MCMNALDPSLSVHALCVESSPKLAYQMCSLNLNLSSTRLICARPTIVSSQNYTNVSTIRTLLNEHRTLSSPEGKCSSLDLNTIQT
jgi:hypothetical protein